MQRISSKGSERAINDSGKIITCHSRTHIAWQDLSREGYFNRVRAFDHATGRWGEPVTLVEGVDNHARGVPVIDNDGVLHAVLGRHGMAVHGCRVLAPNDASEWTKAVPVVVGTYPVILCGPDGTLYLTCAARAKSATSAGWISIACRRTEWSSIRGDGLMPSTPTTARAGALPDGDGRGRRTAANDGQPTLSARIFPNARAGVQGGYLRWFDYLL